MENTLQKESTCTSKEEARVGEEDVEEKVTERKASLHDQIPKFSIFKGRGKSDKKEKGKIKFAGDDDEDEKEGV